MTNLIYKKLTSIQPYHQQLSTLLQNCVQNVVSLGFLATEPTSNIERYWQDVEHHIQNEKTNLWVACVGSEIIGTVQLVRATKMNALHRAEIEKLMVHPEFRQKGIALALLEQAEQHAKQLNLKLIVLDTRTVDVSEQLYLKCGFQQAGHIPDFAMNNDGSLDSTTLFYKQL